MTDASPETQLAALGALLRAQRVSAELSLRELANRTNVSNAYLSELERGLHEPSLRVLRAIASALGTPLGSMLASAGVLGDREDDHPSGVRETEAAILRDAGAQRAAADRAAERVPELRPDPHVPLNGIPSDCLIY